MVSHRREVLQDALDGLKQPLLGDIQGSKGPADKVCVYIRVCIHVHVCVCVFVHRRTCVCVCVTALPTTTHPPPLTPPPLPLTTQKHTPPTITALLRLSFPDVHIITGAFLAGSVAALAQALLPYFTGKIIDAAALESRRSDFDYYTV